MEGDCQNIRELILDLIDGTLPKEKLDELQRHIERCRECSNYLAVLQADDKLLGRYSKSLRPQIERIENSVLKVLEEEGREKQSVRYAGSKSLIKLAAAAVIVIAVLIGIKLFIDSGETQPEGVARQEQVQGTEEIEQKPEREEPALDLKAETKLELELHEIERMFAAGDVDGLVEMLRKGEFDSKVAAASYLAQIGDLSTVEILKQLSEQWTGDARDNPFAKAIAEIEARLKGAEPTGIDSVEKIELRKEEFVPKGELSGLVLDAQTGEPVSDAELKISISRVYTTKTDANGFYHFDEIKRDGGYRIGISSKEYIGIYDYKNEPIVYLKKGQKAVKHFELEPACMIEVLVTDEHGEPIEKAELEPSSSVERYSSYESCEVWTDVNGIAVIGGLAPSDIPYLITAKHRVRIPRKEGERFGRSIRDYAPAGILVRLKDPNVIEFGEIIMKRGSDVSGYAVYQDGVPAEGLKISARPDWRHSSDAVEAYPVDVNGYFTLKHIVPGNYSIGVHVPMGEGGYLVSRVLQTNLPLGEEKLVEVVVPQKSPGSLVSISGRVTVVGGEADFISISAYSREIGSRHVDLWRDMDEFIIDLLEPGVYRLTFSGQDIEPKVLEDVKAPSEGLEVELVFSAKPRLRGAVVRADTGEPVRYFKARVVKLKSLHGSRYNQQSNWHEFNDENGNFNVQAVGPGIYQVQINAEGFCWGLSEEINTDENHPVTVKLSEGGAIKGRVVNEEGKPVSGAKIIPFSKARGTESRTMDSFVSEDGAAVSKDGEFILKNLGEGKESIKVTHPDYSYVIEEDIEVVEGQITDGVRVVLTKGGVIEGYVYDIRGKALHNETLFFYDAINYRGDPDEKSFRFALAVTDEHGYYSVDGLPEKLCYITRGEIWQILGVASRVIVPESGKVFQCNFGGGPVISGQIIIDGEPLADTRVRLGGGYSYEIQVFVCFALTDSQGRFSFAGSPAGIHSIFYRRQGQRSEWQYVSTVNVTGGDMDVGIIPEYQTKVLVTVDGEDKDTKQIVHSLYLSKVPADVMVPAIFPSDEPDKQTGSYVLRNVPPGQYELFIGINNMQIRKNLEILDKEEEKRVLINIPKGTASVSGRFVSDLKVIGLWTKNREFLATLIADKEGVFEINDLPAGEYCIGRNFMKDDELLLTFDLSEGEQKEIEINASKDMGPALTILRVHLIGEGGIPYSGGDVRLEGKAGVIEPITNISSDNYFMAEVGQYKLHVRCPGYKQQSRDITLVETKSIKKSTILIRLKK